jgi:hypothetical protein
MRCALSAVFALLALTHIAAADAVLQGRVVDLLGQPVAGARVHVMAGREAKVVQTDAGGFYRVDLEGDSDVSVVIGAGDLHTFRRGTVKDGTVTTLDLEVEVAAGEVIRILGQKPPTVPPKPVDGPARVTPPYSDEAVLRDAWAKAWLILDVDETGKVLRVKLLKRPGFGLNEIAVREAMKLRFTPALDERGRPMRTQMVWGIEWPSHGWLREHNGTAARLPTESYALNPLLEGFGGVGQPAAPPTGAASLSRVPCAGSGPLDLDLRYPVYRDCSRPNVARASLLPWLDGAGPIPPDPSAPELWHKRTPMVRAPNRLAQVGVTAGAAALIGGFLASYRQYDRYREERVALKAQPSYDLFRYKIVTSREERWRQLSLVSGFLGVAAAGVTAFVWVNPPLKRLSVQPERRGASVSYLTSF